MKDYSCRIRNGGRRAKANGMRRFIRVRRTFLLLAVSVVTWSGSLPRGTGITESRYHDRAREGAQYTTTTLSNETDHARSGTSPRIRTVTLRNERVQFEGSSTSSASSKLNAARICVSFNEPLYVYKDPSNRSKGIMQIHRASAEHLDFAAELTCFVKAQGQRKHVGLFPASYNASTTASAVSLFRSFVSQETACPRHTQYSALVFLTPTPSSMLARAEGRGEGGRQEDGDENDSDTVYVLDQGDLNEKCTLSFPPLLRHASYHDLLVNANGDILSDSVALDESVDNIAIQDDRATTVHMFQYTPKDPCIGESEDMTDASSGVTSLLELDTAASAANLLDSRAFAKMKIFKIIFEPVLNTVMQPVLNPIVNTIAPDILSVLTEDMQHKVNAQTPGDVAEMVALKVTAVLTNTLTDSITARLTNRVSESLTADLGPYLEETVSEVVLEKLETSLQEILEHSIPDQVNRALPDLLSRSLARSLTGELTQSLTHALTHSVSTALADQNSKHAAADDGESCRTCYYEGKNCNLCHNSPASSRYSSYVATYYSDVYASYYASYYKKALVDFDEDQHPILKEG